MTAAAGPFVALLSQDGADGPDGARTFGEDLDDVGGCRRFSRLRRSFGMLDQIWRQISVATLSARASSRCSVTGPEVRIGGNQKDPERLRATRSRRNPSQPAPSTLVVTWMSRIACVSIGVDASGHEGVDWHHSG